MVAASMRRAGFAEEVVYAYTRTGFYIASASRHLYPADELAAWDAALCEFRNASQANQEPGAAATPAGTAADTLDATGGG
jgi:hypothetical protein